MERELQHMRREIDRLLSAHLAEWAEVVASEPAHGLSDYVAVAAELCAARQAIDNARTARMRPPSAAAHGDTSVDEEANSEADPEFVDEMPDRRPADTVSRQVWTELEDVIEEETEQSGRARDVGDRI